jgi:hypothetical protein
MTPRQRSDMHIWGLLLISLVLLFALIWLGRQPWLLNCVGTGTW